MISSRCLWQVRGSYVNQVQSVRGFDFTCTRHARRRRRGADLGHAFNIFQPIIRDRSFQSSAPYAHLFAKLMRGVNITASGSGLCCPSSSPSQEPRFLSTYLVMFGLRGPLLPLYTLVGERHFDSLIRWDSRQHGDFSAVHLAAQNG